MHKAICACCSFLIKNVNLIIFFLKCFSFNVILYLYKYVYFVREDFKSFFLYAGACMRAMRVCDLCVCATYACVRAMRVCELCVCATYAYMQAMRICKLCVCKLCVYAYILRHMSLSFFSAHLYPFTT